MRIWGRSSSGRASGSQSESGEFESRRLQKHWIFTRLSIDNFLVILRLIYNFLVIILRSGRIFERGSDNFVVIIT